MARAQHACIHGLAVINKCIFAVVTVTAPFLIKTRGFIYNSRFDSVRFFPRLTFTIKCCYRNLIARKMRTTKYIIFVCLASSRLRIRFSSSMDSLNLKLLPTISFFGSTELIFFFGFGTRWRTIIVRYSGLCFMMIYMQIKWRNCARLARHNYTRRHNNAQNSCLFFPVWRVWRQCVRMPFCHVKKEYYLILCWRSLTSNWTKSGILTGRQHYDWLQMNQTLQKNFTNVFANHKCNRKTNQMEFLFRIFFC